MNNKNKKNHVWNQVLNGGTDESYSNFQISHWDSEGSIFRKGTMGCLWRETLDLHVPTSLTHSTHTH